MRGQKGAARFSGRVCPGHQMKQEQNMLKESPPRPIMDRRQKKT
jgi:hypothetical protein